MTTPTDADKSDKPEGIPGLFPNDPSEAAQRFLESQVVADRAFVSGGHLLTRLPFVLYRRVAKLLDDYAEKFRPLTMEEAERAFDEAETVPISSERIREIVAFATKTPLTFRDLLREPKWEEVVSDQKWVLNSRLEKASVYRYGPVFRWCINSIGFDDCDTLELAKSAAWDHIVSRISPAFKSGEDNDKQR